MFSWIVSHSLKQRLMVLIFAVGLMVYGIWSLPALKVDVFPDLNKPLVTIMTEAEGLARDVIRQVQQARKDADLDITDRIALTVTAPAATLDAIRAHQAMVSDAVLATTVGLADGEALAVTVARA